MGYLELDIFGIIVGLIRNWNRWIHDDDETLNADREKDTDGFSEYMNTNSDDVYELLDAIIGEKRY